jgi:hypothetical protein
LLRTESPGKFAHTVRDMARAQVAVDPLCSDIRAQSMTAFLERCMGFNGGKTLCYMATGLAQIADLMLANMWREAEDLVLALFLACDQAAINDGKWFYAWQATHLPEPLDTALARKPIRDPLRPFSRLMPPDLSSAITAHSTEGARTADLMKKL